MPVRCGSVAGGIVFRVTRNPRLTLCPFRILVDSDWSLSLIEVDSGGGIPKKNEYIRTHFQGMGDTNLRTAFLQLHLSEGMAAGVGADPYRG